MFDSVECFNDVRIDTALQGQETALAILVLAQAVGDVAYQLREFVSIYNGAMVKQTDSLNNLGNGNANSQMGAIENLARAVEEGFSRLAMSIQEHGDE